MMIVSAGLWSPSTSCRIRVGLSVAPVGQKDGDLDEVSLAHTRVLENRQDVAPRQAALGFEISGHGPVGRFGNLTADEQDSPGVADLHSKHGRCCRGYRSSRLARRAAMRPVKESAG